MSHDVSHIIDGIQNTLPSYSDGHTELGVQCKVITRHHAAHVTHIIIHMLHRVKVIIVTYHLQTH
jgi:hypothetical protein